MLSEKDNCSVNSLQFPDVRDKRANGQSQSPRLGRINIAELGIRFSPMTFFFFLWRGAAKRVRRGFISNDMLCVPFNECIWESVCLTKVFHWGSRYDFCQGLIERRWWLQGYIHRMRSENDCEITRLFWKCITLLCYQNVLEWCYVRLLTLCWYL